MHCNNSTKIGKKDITCVLKAMEVTKRKRRMQQPIQQPMQLLNHDLKEKEFTCVLRSWGQAIEVAGRRRTTMGNQVKLNILISSLSPT